MPSKLPPALRPLWPSVKHTVLRTTKVVAPATRKASRLFGTSALPQRAALDSSQFLSGVPGASMVSVRPAEQLKRPQAHGLPDDYWAFRVAERVTVPETKLAVIPDGRVVGGLGAIIAADDTLLFDLSPYFAAYEPDEHMVFFRFRLPPLTRHDGTVAVLDTRGSDNYYHFTFDILPRLGVLEDAGYTGVDAYYVPQHMAFQRELLSRVGYGNAQLIGSGSTPHLQASRLVVPGIPGPNEDLPSWVIDFLRSRLLPADAASATERIYITRGPQRHSRAIRNEPAVRELLDRLHFRAIDPGAMTVAEQIDAFRSASVIVSPHGAALTNLVYASPGLAVLELFAPDYVNTTYHSLLAQLPETRYRYLMGEGRKAEPRDKLQGVASDITVNVDDMATLLAELGVT